MLNLCKIQLNFSKLIRFLVVTAIRGSMTVRSLVIVRGSVAVTTMSTVTAIRLDLDGVRFDDVIDLLVTGRFVVVASVDGVQVALGVVTVTALVLAVVVVVVVVLYAPVKVVVGGVLRLKKQKRSD